METLKFIEAVDDFLLWDYRQNAPTWSPATRAESKQWIKEMMRTRRKRWNALKKLNRIGPIVYDALKKEGQHAKAATVKRVLKRAFPPGGGAKAVGRTWCHNKYRLMGYKLKDGCIVGRD